MIEQGADKAEIDVLGKVALFIWSVLLIPWLPFALLSGMAFDAGRTTAAYVFVWSAWTYPISVAIAFALRRKIPAFVLLPLLNVFGFLLSG